MEKQEEKQDAIVKIDHKKYGIEKDTALSIGVAFSPVTIETEALLEGYERIIKSELTPSLSKEARAMRLIMVGIRGNNGTIHKVGKALSLATGRCYDAVRNNNDTTLTIMEKRLREIEDNQLIIQQKKILELKEERTKELSKFTEAIPDDIGAMHREVYDNYLLGAKVTYEAKIEAEKKVKEELLAAEKAKVLHDDRMREILPYWNFVPSDKRDIDFSKLPEDEWRIWFEYTVEQKEKHEAEQERIKKENEKLILEAKERGRLAKIEADKRAKVEAERIRKEEIEQKKRDDIEAEKLAEYEKKEQDRIDADLKRQQEQDAILYKERQEKEKLEAELQAKNDADALREKQEQDLKEVELSKDDDAKKEGLVKDLEALMIKYTFKSRKNQTMWLRVVQEFSKIIKYIEE